MSTRKLSPVWHYRHWLRMKATPAHPTGTGQYQPFRTLHRTMEVSIPLMFVLKNHTELEWWTCSQKHNLLFTTVILKYSHGHNLSMDPRSIDFMKTIIKQSIVLWSSGNESCQRIISRSRLCLQQSKGALNCPGPRKHIHRQWTLCAHRNQLSHTSARGNAKSLGFSYYSTMSVEGNSHSCPGLLLHTVIRRSCWTELCRKIICGECGFYTAGSAAWQSSSSWETNVTHQWNFAICFKVH